MEIFETAFESPLGWLRICCTDTAVTTIAFHEKEPVIESRETNLLLENCVGQLTEYFNGAIKTFDLPLQQTGTDFQQRVWNLLLTIPFGKTLSYQTLSKQYGEVKAIRAIAAANGRNNIAIVVPCHRVIGSNQSLTGYAGGLWRKQWLLEHEAKWANGVQQLF